MRKNNLYVIVSGIKICCQLSLTNKKKTWTVYTFNISFYKFLLNTSLWPRSAQT